LTLRGFIVVYSFCNFCRAANQRANDFQQRQNRNCRVLSSGVFAFSLISSSLFFQTHINFHLGFYSRQSDGSNSLESRICRSRSNTFPCFLGEYFISYVSFREIFVSWISCRVRESNGLMPWLPLVSCFSKCVPGLQNWYPGYVIRTEVRSSI